MSTAAPHDSSAAARPIIGHIIDGVGDERTTRSAPVFNPATGRIIAEVALADAEVVGRAVAAAQRALPVWSEAAPLKRARILFELKGLLDAHRDELAAVITREHGKVVSDAKGEVQRGIEVVEFACGIPQLLKGQHSDNVGGGIDNWSLRQPLGVCAGITPFNFPAMVPMWMFP
ncbi:MAG TPA: aldehyde dehydrogenase family protein, partial [Gammaproteobacteria bacterium]